MSTFQADPTDNSQNNPSTDEEIMRLFMQHQPMLFVFLHSILNDWEDAEEALQETSIVLWRKREQFAPGTSFVNWAMTIAQYQAHRFLRGRKQTPRLFNEQLLEQMTSEMVAEHDVFEARHRALRQCLERLQERDRYLISVAYGVNASKKSVSERLGMIPSRFYKVLNRIRQQLQKCIEQRLAAEGRT